MFKILIPCHGDKTQNLDSLVKSIDFQNYDCKVECYFLEDQIAPNFRESLINLCSNSSDKFLIKNESKERLYGIYNIYRFLTPLDSEKEKDTIFGIIDCDDQLWGKDCFTNIKSEYDSGHSCVWTANELKGIGINFSGPLVQNCDVYSHPWVSSHFKTFKLSDFKSVPFQNFQDENKDWFEACYDQVLMLPILHNIFKRGGSAKYIDKVHYIYNGIINPDPGTRYRKSQLETENFIRSRGYVCE